MCLCEADDWRALKEEKKACPHRDTPGEDNLGLFERMLGGEFRPGEISMVVKTDIAHPNPAVRDFVALRLLDDEVVDELGTAEDFVGHAGGSNFMIITVNQAADAITRRLQERFSDEVVTHYTFVDRERGYIEVSDGYGGIRRAPIMTLAIGAVSDEDAVYSDIREITEAAAEARRSSGAT